MIKQAIKNIAYDRDCSVSEATYLYNNPETVESHTVSELKQNAKT